jgi:hypothetical protein
MLPAIPPLASFLKVLGILKTAAMIKKSFFGDAPFNSKSPKKRASGYKADRTVFTEYHKNIIKARYQINCDLKCANHKDSLTLDELAENLNSELGLHKSRQSYAKVWNSKD